MAKPTEIREFALQNNCSDAIALKILSLRAENARLREALDKINEWGDEEDEWDAVERYQAVRLIARAALAKDKP